MYKSLHRGSSGLPLGLFTGGVMARIKFFAKIVAQLHRG